MPFEIGQSIKGLCGWKSGSLLTSTLGSPVWISIILVIIFTLIVICVIPCKTMGFKNFLKYLFYTSIGTLSIMFLHSSANEYHYVEKYDNDNEKELFNTIRGEGELSSLYPNDHVNINQKYTLLEDMPPGLEYVPPTQIPPPNYVMPPPQSMPPMQSIPPTISNPLPVSALPQYQPQAPLPPYQSPPKKQSNLPDSFLSLGNAAF